MQDIVTEIDGREVRITTDSAGVIEDIYLDGKLVPNNSRYSDAIFIHDNSCAISEIVADKCTEMELDKWNEMEP